MSAPAITIRGLHKRFLGHAVLRGVDLDVPSGSVLALLGPNGAGKTTILEICAGTRRADAGLVRVLDLDPANDGGRLRAAIGVMPQGGGAYPRVGARRMLRLVAACSASPLPIDWLPHTLGLDRCARIPYKQLSGGQQQRLALACAVVGRPRLVLLDEPTAGLDPQTRAVVWELIAALRNDGVSVLFTTHRFDEAEVLADQITIVDRGRVVASGSPDSLAMDGLDPQVWFLARPGLDVAALSGVLPSTCRAEGLRPGSYRVSGPVDPDVVSLLSRWCAAEGALVDQLQVARPALEDRYAALTGAAVPA